MNKPILRYGIKLLLSAGALWLAFTAVNLSEVKQFVAALDWRFALLSVLCLHGAHFFGALRLWDYMHVMVGHKLRLGYILWLHYVGAMFNMFLPSSVGGDGYKAWVLAKRLKLSVMSMVHVMLSNRANGLLMLFLLLAVLLLQHDGFASAVPYYEVLVLSATAFIAAVYLIAAWLLWKESLRLQLRMLPCSLGVQGMMLLSVYMLLLGFESEHRLEYLMLMLISSIVSLLPISIGGIGLREMLLLYVGPYFSLDPEQAVSFAAIYSLVHLSISVVGIAPYLMGDKIKAE